MRHAHAHATQPDDAVTEKDRENGETRMHDLYENDKSVFSFYFANLLDILVHFPH